MCRWLAYRGSRSALPLIPDAKPLVGGAVPRLAARRGDRQRRRVRIRLVSDGSAAGAAPSCSAGSSLRGTTRTCGRSAARSSRRCSSLTCGPRPARRSSRRTATRSARELAVHAQRCARRVRLIKRDLTFAVDPSLYPHIRGTTDSEVLFHLALTLGLPGRPGGGRWRRPSGWSSRSGREHGVQFPMQGTIAVSDGTTLWAFRYSSQGRSRTLFHSADVPTLREMYPDVERLRPSASTRKSSSLNHSTTCRGPSSRCRSRRSRCSTRPATTTSRSSRPSSAESTGAADLGPGAPPIVTGSGRGHWAGPGGQEGLLDVPLEDLADLGPGQVAPDLDVLGGLDPAETLPGGRLLSTSGVAVPPGRSCTTAVTRSPHFFRRAGR